jgi:2-alkenal reductase
MGQTSSMSLSQMARSAPPVVGEDLHSDLAVLLVEDFPAGVNPLPLGSMEDLVVGQTVVAIGNPFGFEGTLTQGIISGLGRTIPAQTNFSIPQAIQTDASINPGNSGGPLLNLKGEVIGINDLIQTTDGNGANSGVGFAIPVSVIQRVVPSLIENGEYNWPWLGVRGSSLDLGLIQLMDIPVEKGAYLWQILPGGPAEKAGLVGASKTEDYNGRRRIPADVVTAIDGITVDRLMTF